MQFVYRDVLQLEGKPKVGTRQCVALVQTCLPGIGHTSTWKAGAAVLNNDKIEAGTAIATFVNGHYPNRSHGNHAALFVRHAPNGFWIMDQWSDDAAKPVVSSRLIHHKRPANKNGAWPLGGENAMAYAIIES
ncbi:MAG: BPSL0067 family protein [Telluria sp.]